MLLKFSITIRVWEHKISGSVRSFSGLKTGKISFLGAPVVLGNFNNKVLGAKLPKKAKDRTFKHYKNGTVCMYPREDQAILEYCVYPAVSTKKEKHSKIHSAVWAQSASDRCRGNAVGTCLSAASTLVNHLAICDYQCAETKLHHQENGRVVFGVFVSGKVSLMSSSLENPSLGLLCLG